VKTVSFEEKEIPILENVFVDPVSARGEVIV
jgi:hypothetical protein